MTSAVKRVQASASKLTVALAAAVLLAGGVFVSSALGAGGGGDPCADGIPDARFGLAPGTKGVGSLEVSLDAQHSVACASPIAEYSWDFGDGTSAQGMNASHEYGVGTFRPTLTITDEAGLTDSRTYYADIIVKADNQNPVILPVSAEVLQGEYVSVNVAPGTTDSDGDSLAYGFFLPADEDNGWGHVTEKGWVNVDSQNGTFNYRANSNSAGQDSFEVGVRDGFGGVGTAMVTVQINQHLTAVDDHVTTYAGTPVTVNVTNNDSSFDGWPFEVYWWWGSDDGRVDYNQDGSFTFTPNAGFAGTASFEYGINDSDSLSAHRSFAYVYIDVQVPPNFAPTAVNDSLSINEDVNGSLNILGNDSDQDGDSLSVSLSGGPQHGSASLSPSGMLTYVPAANYNGSDSVSYVVTDSKGAASSATVEITVRSVNDVPAVAADNAQVDEDSAVTIAVLSNDNDVENGRNLSVQIVNSPANGTAKVNADGTVSYQPKANHYGTDNFAYRAVDADGASRQATVTVNIASVNDAPTAIFSATIAAGNRLQLDASGSADVDGAITSYQWNFGNGQTATTSTPSTSYKYKARGTYQVILTVTDAQGVSATFVKTVSI